MLLHQLQTLPGIQIILRSPEVVYLWGFFDCFFFFPLFLHKLCLKEDKTGLIQKKK